MKFRVILSVSLFLIIGLFSFTFKDLREIFGKRFELPLPKGFPRPDIPEENYLTQERVKLGKMLFYDKLLSSDSSISCGSCHAPQSSFSDAKKLSIGVNNELGDRNSMPLINLAWANSFMWDGGVTSLELQIMNPLINHKEMNIQITEVLTRLNKHDAYPKLFKKAYGCKPDAGSLFKAIACFERTLVSSNSKYDQYYYGKNSQVFNDSEVRGYYLFNSEKTHCTSCHTGFNFTNNTFQNNGLYLEYADQGRYKITFKEEDKGKFKVPTLRNIELTAPYMHDGSFKTLAEVVDHYNNGGKPHSNRSSHVHNNDSPPLSVEEKEDLINFLLTLTDTSFVNNPALLP